MAESDDAHLLMDAIAAGRHVFLTGAAGTGKSYLIERVRQAEETRRGRVFVTASTGIAAINVGGSTVHAWAGIRPACVHDIGAAVAVVRANRAACDRWRECRLLVIDEVSMVDADLLDVLDSVGRAVRNEPRRALGGVQVLLVGDFFQMPPVAGRYAFHSLAWRYLDPAVVVLQHVYRQSDPAFAALLEEVRVGRPSPATLAALRRRVAPASGDVPESDPNRIPTRLRALNRDVDAENVRELERLRGPAWRWEARDAGPDRAALAQLQRSCIAPAVLALKTGAQVVLLKNVDTAGGLVNGSRGVVVGFEWQQQQQQPERGCGGAAAAALERVPVVRFAARTMPVPRASWCIDDSGAARTALATRSQVPLRLAWALTVHRAQGMSLDAVEVSTRGVFEYGQVYAALSRARTLDGLILSEPLAADAIRAHPDVIRFYANGCRLPAVREST